jgi:anti-anti-sigma factor
MSLEISLREAGQGTIIDLAGDLVLPECEELHREVKKLLQGGTRRVCINLEEVGSVDQQGLGTLSACYVSVLREFATLSLLGPSEDVRDTIRRIRLEQVVTIYDTEEDFIQAAGPSGLKPLQREGLHFAQQLQQILCGVVWVFLAMVLVVLWMQFSHPAVLDRLTLLVLLEELVLSPVADIADQAAPVVFYLIFLLFLGSAVLLLFDSRFHRLRRLLK